MFPTKEILMSASKLLSRMAVTAMLSTIVMAPFAVSGASTSGESSGPRFTLRVTPQRVSDDLIQKISNGMKKEDVTSINGAPNRTAEFTRSSTLSWDYDYVDTWGHEARFSVIFNGSGQVVGKTSAPYAAG